MKNKRKNVLKGLIIAITDSADSGDLDSLSEISEIIEHSNMGQDGKNILIDLISCIETLVYENETLLDVLDDRVDDIVKSVFEEEKRYN